MPIVFHSLIKEPSKMRFKKMTSRLIIAVVGGSIPLMAGLLIGCISTTQPGESAGEVKNSRVLGDLAGFDLIQDELNSTASKTVPSDSELDAQMQQWEVPDYSLVDDYILLEGDIWLEKTTFGEMIAKAPTSDELAKVAQQFRVERHRVSSGIWYYWLDPKLGGNWMNAFKEGYANWNSVIRGPIFRYTSDKSKASTKIWRANVGETSTDACASASFPVKKSGTQGTSPDYTVPGNVIRVPPKCDNQSHSFKVNVAVHEIGHNLGFMHTGVYNKFSFLIPGTPSWDIHSVMNTNARPAWTGFSNGDYKAIEIMYPGAGSSKN